MAMSSGKGKMPKSILKKTNEQSEDAASARNRELAMHHALVIQHQKDTETAILESIEALIEYPLKTTDPANPDPSDVKEVKQYLTSFRPSDFDSTVQERNLDEKCGYMLCPRPRIKQKTTAKFRLLQRQNLEVVKTSDLEKWCSDDCARRAFYLRVQLKESPPWERIAAGDDGLQLYGEFLSSTPQGDMDLMTTDLQQLALERGDVPDSFRAKSMNINLQERFESMALDDPVPPALDARQNAMQVEGYSSGMAKNRQRDPLDIDMIKDRGDILDAI